MENVESTDMGTRMIREPIVNKLSDWCYNIFFKFDGRVQDNQKGEAIVELSAQSPSWFCDIYVHVERNGKQMRRKMKPCMQRDLIAAACVDAVKQPDLFMGTSLPS